MKYHNARSFQSEFVDRLMMWIVCYLVPELCTAGTPEEGCAARDHWATPENMG